MLLFTLLLTTSAAAQDVSMVQGFAEGFTFHSHFAGNRRIDPDGAVVGETAATRILPRSGRPVRLASFSRTPSTSMKASAEPRW
jgi:hypothetical protein